MSTTTPTAAPSLAVSRMRGWLAPTIVIACLLAAMVIAMRWQGRVWFSTTGLIKIWHTDVWSAECSQQFTDPYSITHMSHGLIFAGLFWCLARLSRARPALAFLSSTGWQLAGGMAFATGWEVLENSSFIIDRYRTATMSFEYLGDSIFNAVGDVASCGVGYFVARRLGLWLTLALLVTTEVLLLILIRDNLTLNVIMLIHPIESIKQWQSVGH